MRSVVQPRSALSGSPFQLRVRGAIGDTAFLLGGGVFVHLPQTLSSGILQVDQTIGRRRVGSIPPSGELLVPLTAPTLPAGEVHPLALQVVLLLPSGEIRFAPADLISMVGPGVPTW